jgi:CheY-like chemotaxis protein
MPAGGTLTIETSNVDDVVPPHDDHAVPRRYVLLAVSDSGCGMAPDVKARVFEPFFTTKGPGRGTGLGLTTVQTIVEESGGFVRLDTAPGAGSTVKVYLPAVTDPPALEQKVDAIPEPPRGRETVLLVEDNDQVRTVIGALLSRWGYTVVEASGPSEAIRLSDGHPGPLDLLVTDVVMPELGGRELAERLTLARPNLKVLYISGYAADSAVRDRLQTTDVAFLQKPFGADLLARKVRDVLDGKLR